MALLAGLPDSIVHRAAQIAAQHDGNANSSKPHNPTPQAAPQQPCSAQATTTCMDVDVVDASAAPESTMHLAQSVIAALRQPSGAGPDLVLLASLQQAVQQHCIAKQQAVHV